MDKTSPDTLSQKVEELTRENKHVLSIVSHDLRSPLNRIFALIQLVQMGGDNLSPEQNDYLEKMHLIVADGLAMMRNLVDYRNIEYRTIDLHPETLNISELITRTIKNFSSIAAKKNIQLLATYENDLVITTDKLCIERVLDNLIANGLKFSPPGKKITIRAIIESDILKISVQDEVGGFLPEEQPKIFQKFQKLSARPTAGESSTGLGLFVAQSMANKIGGNISFSIIEKQGSIFSVEIPKSIK